MSITYDELLDFMRKYVEDQKACGYPAQLQDLREFRRWKNMPQNPEHDKKLLLEINGNIGQGR